jgi:signal transduction histidine kinase
MDMIRKKTLLIVDDEEINLEILNGILMPEYSVYMTKSGKSAVEIAENYLPSVILLDILMPDMDGYEVLSALKKSDKTRNIPVILITGFNSVEDGEKSLDTDAADYIHKPFNAGIVKARVRNQIKQINQIHAEEKSRFFTRMSHEMRTPLNAVIGLSEIALDTGCLSYEVYDYVEKINNTGSALLSMVNDILDISKIESGKFELVPVEYDCAEMINDTVTQNIIRKEEKPVEFVLNIGENIPKRLYGDDLRIKQILNNLLSNSFKYTKEGIIEFEIKYLKKDEDIWLIITVRDTGIGMKNEDIAVLFTDFVQIDISSNRTIEGTGLGLSITKMIVELMGGKISVKSEYGKGSEFSVEIPQKFVTGEVIEPEIVNALKNFCYQSRKRKLRPVRISMPYARILVVDDVITNLDVARGMMKPYKMKIDCVTSGQQAVDIIRKEKVKYNAVFMDQVMPIMDGIEAVRIIREEIGTGYAKNIPIIAFTANAFAGSEEMFLSKGFNAFISKPIDIMRLDAVIKQWIRDEELEKTLTGNLVIAEVFEDRNGTADRKKRIEGLDINKGLRRFNGDWETFLQVIKSFAVNTMVIIEAVKDVNEDNLKDYIVTIHGVKSSCYGICAEEAGSYAEALEKAARASDLNFIKSKTKFFTEILLKLITEIETVLCNEEGNAANKNKPKKDKPYIEALLKLCTACENYNALEVDAVMEEIEVFDYEADDGLVKWLRKNVNEMNFTEIAGRLSVNLRF